MLILPVETVLEKYYRIMEDFDMRTVTFRMADMSLRASGWYEIRCNGSHHQYRHPSIGSVVTVPARRTSEVLSRNVVKNIEKATSLSLAG